jgi:hypothetical protein
MKRGWRSLGAAALLIALTTSTEAAQIFSGVSFAQVDFTYPSAPLLDSPYGQVFVDNSVLGGLGSGFVSVVTDVGWVVQNVPVVSGAPGFRG